MSAGLTRLGARQERAVRDVEPLHAVDLAVRVDDARGRVEAGHHRAQRVRGAGEAHVAVDADEAGAQQAVREVADRGLVLGLGLRQPGSGRSRASGRVAAAGDHPVVRDGAVLGGDEEAVGVGAAALVRNFGTAAGNCVASRSPSSQPRHWTVVCG